MTPSLSQTWLQPLLLLVWLLASGSITGEVSEHCSHMIGNGHLQFLQQLVSVRPCLSTFSPLGKLRQEPGNRVKGKGCGQRNTAVQAMIHGSTDALLLDLLGLRTSDPHPTPKPSGTPPQPVHREGFQQVAWVNGCLEGQPWTRRRLVRPALPQ